MSGFGSNISSLMAQRRLSEVSSSLSRSFERLSTGQRINRASDDAAGLAIADQLKLKVRLYSGGIRNINDALSMINIADSTLDDQSQILIRLKELAEQSSNGVFTSAQRETMNREYFALVKEFGRLGDSATFNGTSLLRAQGQATSIQAGVTGASNSTISVTSGETGTLSGIIDLDDNPDIPATILTGTSATIMSQYGNHMFRFTVTDSLGRSHEVLGAFRNATASDGSDGGYTNKLRVAFFGKTAEVGAVGGTVIDQQIRPGDEWSHVGSGHLAYDPTTGRVSLARDGFDFAPITLAFPVGGMGIATFNLDVSALRVAHSSTSGLLQSALDFTGIETVGRSQDALTILDRKLAELGTLRGQYGAVQNRLMTSLSVLQSSRENSAAAESRIRDIDVASEAARLTASQILQQTAASVLANANQQPALLLQLLRSGFG